MTIARILSAVSSSSSTLSLIFVVRITYVATDRIDLLKLIK